MVKNQQINEQNKKLLENEIASIQQRVREVSTASNYIVRSQVLLDFLGLPENLREFTKPRILSFFSDIRKSLGGGVEWRIVRDGKILFESSKEKVNENYFIKNDINFDFEGNHSTVGKKFGEIYSFIDLSKQLSEAKYIKSISILKNNIHFDSNLKEEKRGIMDSNIFMITSVCILFSMILSIILIRKFVMLPILTRISTLRNDYKINLDIKDVKNEFKILDMYFYEFLQQAEKTIKLNSIIMVTKQIAHDIRSPLEALRSVTGHIDNLDFQHRKIITNSIQRISDIANGLLREGKTTEKLSLVNLNILLDELYQDKVFEHGPKIKFENKTSYKESFISGDENTLYRIFSNLINNAFEAYDSDKGDVVISLETNDSEVIIKVQDSGKGIPQDLIAKILEGGVTTKEKGNGLGVSSSFEEIKKYNGTFEINSKEGLGTTVVPWVPPRAGATGGRGGRPRPGDLRPGTATGGRPPAPGARSSSPGAWATGTGPPPTPPPRRDSSSPARVGGPAPG